MKVKTGKISTQFIKVKCIGAKVYIHYLRLFKCKYSLCQHFALSSEHSTGYFELKFF